MSTSSKATTEATEPEATDDQSTDKAKADESTETRESGNHEAAKYRVQLRETQAERDALTAQLDTARRQMIDQANTDKFIDPADYWRHGGEVTLTDDGTLDVEAMSEAAAAIIAERSHLAKPRPPRPDLSQGGRGETSGQAMSWSDVLAP